MKRDKLGKIKLFIRVNNIEIIVYFSSLVILKNCKLTMGVVSSKIYNGYLLQNAWESKLSKNNPAPPDETMVRHLVILLLTERVLQDTNLF